MAALRGALRSGSAAVAAQAAPAPGSLCAPDQLLN